MYTDIRLRIIDCKDKDLSHIGIGPGLVELLEEIEVCKSVTKASEKMGMSISKCWRIIKSAEKNRGRKLTQSISGGTDGGQTLLTDYAKTIVRIFRQIEEETYKTANRELEKFCDQF